MPRPRLRLGPGEARDRLGIIHTAIGSEFNLTSACDNQKLGTNPTRLSRYCDICFPGRSKPKVNYMDNLPSLDLDGGDDPGNIAGARAIAQAGMYCEEIITPSWELTKPKPKPKSTKTLDEILRRPQRTFTRRVLHNFSYYGTKLKDS